METSRREKRSYTDEFKHQIIMLYQNGKTKSELIREYDLTPSALHKWIKNFDQSGSFKQKDNLTLEEKKINRVRKRKQAIKDGK